MRNRVSSEPYSSGWLRASTLTLLYRLARPTYCVRADTPVIRIRSIAMDVDPGAGRGSNVHCKAVDVTFSRSLSFSGSRIHVDGGTVRAVMCGLPTHIYALQRWDEERKTHKRKLDMLEGIITQGAKRRGTGCAVETRLEFCWKDNKLPENSAPSAGSDPAGTCLLLGLYFC